MIGLNKKKEFTVTNNFEYSMVSSTGKEYRILISEPTEQAPPNGYAVVYVLDADGLFQTVAEAVKLQTRKPKGEDPILVVGIGYPSKEPFDMDRRCFDFTMPTDGATLPERPNKLPWPTSGGADQFLDFMEKELQPLIEKDWKIDQQKKCIIGHSLGGLLTLHAAFTRPNLFSHYVAGSPSTWWAERKIFEEFKQFSRDWKEAFPLSILVAIGSEEQPDMVKGAKEIATQLQTLQKQKVQVEYMEFADADHITVLPCTISRVPRFCHQIFN